MKRRADLLEKTLILGKTEGRRRRGRQKTRWLDGVTDLLDISKLRKTVKDREAWCAVVHGVAKSGTQMNNNRGRRQNNLEVKGSRSSLHVSSLTRQETLPFLGALSQAPQWGRGSVP